MLSDFESKHGELGEVFGLLHFVDRLDKLVLVFLQARALLVIHHFGFDCLQVAIQVGQERSVFALGRRQLVDLLTEGRVASQLLLYLVLGIVQLSLERCQRVLLSIATLLLQIFDVEFQIQTLHRNK